METNYEVIDPDKNNADDFGKHINVEFLYNADQFNEVIYETTLYELQDMTPEAVSDRFFDDAFKGGIKVGSEHDFLVKFTFVDNDEDQNQFQGDSLNLEWTFHAEQGEGGEK